MCVKGRLDIGLERIGSTGLKDKDTTTRFSSYFYFAFRWIWPGSSYSTLAPRGDGDKIKKKRAPLDSSTIERMVMAQCTGVGAAFSLLGR